MARTIAQIFGLADATRRLRILMSGASLMRNTRYVSKSASQIRRISGARI
jgi:hypothetical protein